MADFRLGMRVRVNHTMPYPTNWDITGTVEVIPGQALGKIRRHRSDWLGVRFDDGEIVEFEFVRQQETLVRCSLGHFSITHDHVNAARRLAHLPGERHAQTDRQPVTQ